MTTQKRYGLNQLTVSRQQRRLENAQNLSALSGWDVTKKIDSLVVSES